MSDPQATDVETPTDPAAQLSTQQPAEPDQAPGVTETTEAPAPVADEAALELPDKTDKTDKKSRVRQLEREGEVAADFLETLLDIADLDGDIDVDVDGDRAAIAIVDSDEGRVPR